MSPPNEIVKCVAKALCREAKAESHMGSPGMSGKILEESVQRDYEWWIGPARAALTAVQTELKVNGVWSSTIDEALK
jgi:hypothetical protein